MTSPSVGSKLGNYRLERVLGEGRMGIVFLAHDEALLRRTAVKVLAWKFPADEAVRTPDAHLLAEAQLAARISHPNVVRVYGVARHGEHCFIGMEYIDGASADAAIKQHGVFSFERTNEILLQVATGLQAVHDARVVHRDLKPENLLIAADGTTKIVDFGMALQLVRGRASEASRAGTPLYTAPELWQGGPATAASDIYALGATYYFLLTGRPPFDASDLASLIDAHLTRPAPDVRLLRPDVPEGCHALIQRCLAKSSAERFGSAQELAWEARGLLRQSASEVRPRAGTDTVGIVAEAASRVPGFHPDLFGPLEPDDPQIESEPFADLRAQLAELGTEGGPAVMLLVGPPGSGRTMLARRLMADHRRHGIAVYLGPTDAPERSPLHLLARNLGVVAALSDARSTIDRIIQHLASPPASRPALVIIDRGLPEAALAEIAQLGRGAKACGSFCVLVTGGPELPAALAALDPPDRTRTLTVPALTAIQTLRYIQTRLRHARVLSPSIAVTPDTGLLVFHHSAGNLARIDHLMKAMLARAVREHRVVLSSRDVGLAVDPSAALPASWPTPPALEIINATRRDIGLAPRRGDDGPAYRHVELVAQLPGVTSVVLSHVSGAVLEARGELDGEIAGTADARLVHAFAKAGVQLGLGELRTSAVIGSGEIRLIHREPGLVLASGIHPTAQLPPLEDQISRILRD